MKNKQFKFYDFFFFVIAIVLLLAVNTSEVYSQNKDYSQKTANCKKNKKSSKNLKKGKSKNKLKEKNNLPIQPGVWGTTGTNLTVDDEGARIEYDCADGEITEKFIIDADGNFALSGFYTAQTPGPISIDKQPVRRPARFEGKISENQMTLKVTLTDTDEKLEKVLLERDRMGKIRRCY